jgi:hypothetical protein
MNFRFGMIIFDIETKLKNKKQLATHCGYLERDWMTYSKTPLCIHNFIKDLQLMEIKSINLYAHNFANFDSFFVVPVLLAMKVKISKMYVRNNSIIFLQCSIDSTVLTFRDSYLYANISLVEILKMFN